MKAAKWDRLQASKGKARKKAEGKPNVQQPNKAVKKGKNSSNSAKSRQAKQRLNKSGSRDDALDIDIEF